MLGLVDGRLHVALSLQSLFTTLALGYTLTRSLVRYSFLVTTLVIVMTAVRLGLAVVAQEGPILFVEAHLGTLSLNVSQLFLGVLVILVSPHVVEIAIVGSDAHAAVCARQFLTVRNPSRALRFIRKGLMVLLLFLGAGLVAELTYQI